MQFYEKLVFIMNLTQTSNRKLAQALRVDPSIISRLRTGKRGIPRNSELLRSMALFFSERCNTDYQRRALSEIVGVKRIITARRDYLSEFLFQWLCGNADGVERFMRTFESLKIGAAASKADLDPKTFCLLWKRGETRGRAGRIPAHAVPPGAVYDLYPGR